MFLIFRYQTMNDYVDNRKPLLRSLLKTQMEKNPYVMVRIKDIGKDSRANDVQFFSQFNNEAVSRFVEDILEFRRKRAHIVLFGQTSIEIWAGLSVYYLINSYFFSNTSCLHELSIGFFIGSLVFTIYFIFISLYIKRPE